VPSRSRLVVKRDQVFPYSKGLMAQSLMACGIAPDRAYRTARILEAELRRGDQTLVTSDDLRARALVTLGREEGAEAVDRYRRWHQLRHLDRPLMVLIGGAPGSGKSTIATEIAHRLGITRIVSTDVVRQVMRGVIAPDVLPQIHTSSFGGGALMPVNASNVDRTLAGFRQQADTVRVGLRGVVARAVQERFPLVLEGVHLVPGMALLGPDAGAIVVEVVVAVASEQAHQAHFELRADHTGDGRPVERYMSAFAEIRRIQRYLVERATDLDVAVVESSDLDAAVRQVMDLVLARVVSASGGAAPLALLK